MQKVGSECILCGNSERELLIRKEEWTVYRCIQCGLGFLDPRPDPEELGRLYRMSYFKAMYDSGLAPDSPEMKRRLSQKRHRIRFFRRFKKKGRILDMGCGLGYFLYACREAGYNVEGMDISEDCAAYVRNTLKIKVTTGSLNRIGFDQGTFDVITMWHFLEHSPDPREYLRQARQWLKPGRVFSRGCPQLRRDRCAKDMAGLERLVAALSSIPFYARRALFYSRAVWL